MAQQNSAQQENSYRMMFRFWLDAGKDDELELADYCESMKHQRSFASTIRDALRLIWDLREKKLDVLFALFPWVHAWLEERAEAIAQGIVQSSKFEDVTHLNTLQAQLTRLEQAILQQGGIPIADGIRPSQVLPQPRLLAPQSDDDIAIGVKRVEGTGSVQNNFLKAISAAAGVNFPDETKTPPARRKSRATTRKTAPVPPPAAGIRKLDVQQFVVPTFDDDDDGINLFK